MATLTPVTITSENPKYPNHKVTVLVDNDLSANTTITIPGTYFPYIIQIAGVAGLEDKRFISEWLYGKLINEYKTNFGKILYSLKKETSSVPYYTLDYNLFRDKVTSLQNAEIEVQDETGMVFVKELDYLGSAIGNFDDVSPEYLLKWLDFPIKDGTGEPVEIFPFLLDYKSSPVLLTDLTVINHITAEFFQPEYIVQLFHNITAPVIYFAATNYNETIGKYNFTEGEYSRPVTYLKIQNASQQQSLDFMLSKALNPNLPTSLPNTNLAAAAKSVKDKLDQLKALGSSLPKLPKIPRVNKSKFMVTLRIKLLEKKNIKRTKKSSKSNVTVDSKPSIKNKLSSAASKLQQIQNLKKVYESKLTLAQNQLTKVTKQMNAITTT